MLNLCKNFSKNLSNIKENYPNYDIIEDRVFYSPSGGYIYIFINGGGTLMEAKKSLLERLKLIERVEENPEPVSENVVEPEEVKEETPKQNVVAYDQQNQFKVDRLLKVEEIYKKFNLESDNKDTIFIIDSFSKALPDYLPQEIKRQSILNIISSSGMNIVELLKDGSERLSVLKNFENGSSNYTNKLISESEAEIEKLMQAINKCKKNINDRKKLQEEQSANIEYEVQKIQNIIQFINPEK